MNVTLSGKLDRTFTCWKDGPQTGNGESTSCLSITGHKGEHVWKPDDEIDVVGLLSEEQEGERIEAAEVLVASLDMIAPTEAELDVRIAIDSVPCPHAPQHVLEAKCMELEAEVRRLEVKGCPQCPHCHPDSRWP